MEEIKVINNPIGIRIFSVGRPDIDNMAKDDYAVFVASLERKIVESLKEKQRDNDSKKL